MHRDLSYWMGAVGAGGRDAAGIGCEGCDSGRGAGDCGEVGRRDEAVGGGLKWWEEMDEMTGRNGRWVDEMG